MEMRCSGNLLVLTLLGQRVWERPGLSKVGGGMIREGSPYVFAAGGYSRGCRQPGKTGSRCCPLGPGSVWPAASPSAPGG